MKWNKWIRVAHRWLSIAFTVAITINFIAILQKRYTNTLGLMAVSVLALSFITGMYLFVLPYFTKWRSVRRAA
jgi:hypothetical protein